MHTILDALAEENLLFVEAVNVLIAENEPLKVREGITELLANYENFINLSSGAMSVSKQINELLKAFLCQNKKFAQNLNNRLKFR